MISNAKTHVANELVILKEMTTFFNSNVSIFQIVTIDHGHLFEYKMEYIDLIASVALHANFKMCVYNCHNKDEEKLYKSQWKPKSLVDVQCHFNWCLN